MIYVLLGNINDVIIRPAGVANDDALNTETGLYIFVLPLKIFSLLLILTKIKAVIKVVFVEELI